jgi:hypothetical protein
MHKKVIDIPSDVDRVVRVFGEGTWFNPINDLVLYLLVNGEIVESDYTRTLTHNTPIKPVFIKDF